MNSLAQQLVSSVMSRRLPIIGAVVAACMFASMGLSVSASPATVSAYKVSQEHFTLGKLELAYTNDAVKMTFERNGAVLVAKAPAWDVVLYRSSGRVYWKTAYAEFLRGGLRWVQINGLDLISHTKKTEKTVNGEKIVDYVGSLLNGSTYRYSQIEPPKTPDQACRIIDRAYRFPPGHAIPLSLDGEEVGHDDLRNPGNVAWQLTVNTRRPGGKTEMWRLKTKSWSRVIMPASDFDYPVGYRLVKSEPEVLLTSNTRDIIEDMFGGDDKPAAKGAKR